MKNSDIDWNSIQNEFDNEIISKIYKFTANEFSSYNSEFPVPINLNESVQKQWETFLQQFTSYIPVFEPHFYSDKIRNDYMREISPNLFSNLVGLFQKLIERTKWKNKKVYKRLHSEYTFPKYINEYDIYLKSSTSFLETCNNAIFSLQSPQTDAKYIEIALRYEMLKYSENFAIENLYQIYKHFPIIRRREILQIASERFISDTQNEMNENLLPKLIQDPESMINELRRLSELMNVQFDIDSHDGQFFCYLCEKLYGQCSAIPFTIENTTNDIPLVADPTLLNRLNYDYLNEIPIDSGMKFSYEILESPSDKKLNELMRKFNNSLVKLLTNDKVTALLRLQFSRNKKLFHSIIESIETLSKLRDEINQLNKSDDDYDEEPKEQKPPQPPEEKVFPVRSPDELLNADDEEGSKTKLLSEEELQKLNQKKSGRKNKGIIKSSKKKKEEEVKKELTFVEKEYSTFRKEILAAASMIKSSSNSLLDNDSVLEMLLDLFDRYYKEKLEVVNSLIEINRDLPPLNLIDDHFSKNFKFDVKGVAFKYIQLRPMFLGGAHNTCLTPIRLSLDSLEKMSTAIRTMINFQIFSHNYFMNSNKDLFSYFEFPEFKPVYQKCKGEFPYSFPEFFFCLSRIPDFVATSFRIASEICTSFSIKSLKLEHYFLYATWEQLLREMNSLFSSFEPESFKFNMNMSDVVSKIMTSPYLIDLHFINEKMEKIEDENKKYEYIKKVRLMINLTNILRNYLIQTDSMLPIFKRQANQIAKTDIKDVIDLAYGDYDFASIEDENWSPDELIKIIKSQKNFYLSLLIAVRFNNFSDDALFIQDFYQMHNPIKTSSDQFQQILRNMPKTIFYDPSYFMSNDFTSVFCDISPISKEVVSNTEYIVEQYLPYLLKTEIAFICGYERSFMKHYSSTDVFVLNSTPEMDSILTKDNKLNFFYVPTHFQSLNISSNSIDELHKILHFVSIRLQMNEWTRHDSHIKQTKAKTLENIYSENLLFTTPFFSHLYAEINKEAKCGEIDFTIEYFEIERITYICKHILTALTVYDSVIAPETKASTFITTASKPVITYSIDSVKSYINDILKPPMGRSTFMTPSLYVQKCMNQFWYQCNDQFRSDFLAALSTVEQKIDDSIIGYQNDNYRINAYNFALDWLRLSLLKLGYYHLLAFHDPSKVSFRNAINDLDTKSYSNGRSLFDTNVNVKSTARIGSRPNIGTIETALMNERTRVMINVLKSLFQNDMKNIITEKYSNQLKLIDDAFSAPNQTLKPDCYSKVMKINSIHTNYLPTTSSIREQFSQELGYARSHFLHSLYRLITLKSKQHEELQQISLLPTPDSSKSAESQPENSENNNENNEDNSENNNENSENQTEDKENQAANVPQTRTVKIFDINLSDINNELVDISSSLESFIEASRTQQMKTWSGYLLNNLREYSSHSELQIFLNMYVSLFKSNYNNTINFKLATKLSEKLNSLSHFRDEEQRKNREQIQFEKRVTNEIRAEFDLLVSDLAEEIRKAKQKWVDKKNEVYSHAFYAIDRFKENPEFIKDITSKDPKYSLGLLTAPLEIQDPALRTLVKVQVQKRKQEREQRRKLKKLRQETKKEGESNEDDDDSIDTESLNSENDEFDEEGRKKRKEKDIDLEMEKTKAEIEQLQEVRKKLRVANSLSTIGFINIYNRMINKVAEEKKTYSAKLLHNHRLYEEEMTKINEDLRGAYNILTNAEINVEQLKNEIEEGKKKTAKLLHWKEMSLRKSGEIQKELKILTNQNTNSGNVNVTQLLKKISEKNDELEMLNYENEKLNEELYHEVQEPMAQLDYMRREITRRRAMQAQMIQEQQRLQSSRSNFNENEEEDFIEQQQIEEEEEMNDEEGENGQNRSSQVSFTLPKSPRKLSSSQLNQSSQVLTNEEEEETNERPEFEMSFSEIASSRTVSQRGFSKMQELLKENELLKEDNKSLKKQIEELENQLKSTPKNALPLLTDLFTVKQAAPASARPRSTRHSKKTIVRPGVGRAFAGGGTRPQTSRL